MREPLYSVNDVARLVGMHPSSIWRLIYGGSLPAVRIGEGAHRIVRVEQGALDALIQQHQGGVHRPRAGRK